MVPVVRRVVMVLMAVVVLAAAAAVGRGGPSGMERKARW